MVVDQFVVEEEVARLVRRRTGYAIEELVDVGRVADDDGDHVNVRAVFGRSQLVMTGTVGVVDQHRLMQHPIFLVTFESERIDI